MNQYWVVSIQKFLALTLFIFLQSTIQLKPKGEADTHHSEGKLMVSDIKMKLKEVHKNVSLHTLTS